MASIFLSHSHADKELARRLARGLRNAGVKVWIDEAELDIGDSLVEKIGQAIDVTDFLAVLLSSNSVRSQWVTREVEIALNQEIAGRKVKVLPLLADDCEIPAFLLGKVYADFRNPAKYQDELSRVLKRLGVDPTTAYKTTTIIFDESYHQDEWYGQPIVSAGYSEIAEDIVKLCNVATNKDGYSNTEVLPPNGILVLPTPYRSIVDDQQYAEITKWVNRGGGLLVFGFYLMDAHHYNNLNNLPRRLGFEFSHNLTMPKGREDFRDCMDQAFAYANRDYWIETTPVGEPSLHSLLDGVAKLALTSSCTVECAAQAELIVSTSDPVAVLHALGHKNPEGRLIQLTDYILDKHATVPFMVALKYGAGRVVGIGTWKIFLNELVSSGHDNKKLFQNIISWLTRNL